jgi:hypothetical protein
MKKFSAILLGTLIVSCVTFAQSPRDRTSTTTPGQLPQAGVASPFQIGRPPDRNCDDFGTWHQAQAFYNAQYAALWAQGARIWKELDPHGLDRDADGAACERNPGSPYAE